MSKVTQQLAGTIILLKLIRAGGTLDIREMQNECTITIAMKWHEIFIIITYEVIIMLVVVFLAKYMSYVILPIYECQINILNKSADHIKYLGIKVMFSCLKFINLL